jgi:hypothetical protein
MTYLMFVRTDPEPDPYTEHEPDIDDQVAETTPPVGWFWTSPTATTN